MPDSFYHLPIGKIHGTLSMQFALHKLAFVYFFIIPTKNTFSLHLTILKSSFILSFFCFHFTMAYNHILWKLAYIFSFSIWHKKFPISFHISISKLSNINFSIWPFINSIIIMFQSINKTSFVYWTIYIDLFTFAIRLIVNPLTFISKSAFIHIKYSITLHFSTFYCSSFNWAIREKIDPILSLYLSINKETFI